MSTEMTARVIPQFERVSRAIVREDGAQEEIRLPEGTDDANAVHRLEGRMQRTFRRHPGACFTWQFAGPREDGVLLVLRVPEKDDGKLDWERARGEFEEMRQKRVPTIEEIRGFQYAGNHAQDGERFNAISRFVASDAPMELKREALQRMQRDGMGVDGEVSEQDVLDYLAEA